MTTSYNQLTGPPCDTCGKTMREHQPADHFFNATFSTKHPPPPRTVEHTRADLQEFLATYICEPSTEDGRKIAIMVEELCRAVFREQLPEGMTLTMVDEALDVLHLRARQWDDQIRQLSMKVQEEGNVLAKYSRALANYITDKLRLEIRATAKNAVDREDELSAEIQEIKQRQDVEGLTRIVAGAIIPVAKDAAHEYLLSKLPEITVKIRDEIVFEQRREQPPPEPQWCCDQLRYVDAGKPWHRSQECLALLSLLRKGTTPMTHGLKLTIETLAEDSTESPTDIATGLTECFLGRVLFIRAGDAHVQCTVVKVEAMETAALAEVPDAPATPLP